MAHRLVLSQHQMIVNTDCVIHLYFPEIKTNQFVETKAFV